ncbi:MAG: hypothetical protein GY937_08085 [bacterium]|nr:hypothetical protein [bacterium]
MIRFLRFLVIANSWDLGAMITHRFPLTDFAEALRTAQDPEASGKVMIEIGEAGA